MVVEDFVRRFCNRVCRYITSWIYICSVLHTPRRYCRFDFKETSHSTAIIIIIRKSYDRAPGNLLPRFSTRLGKLKHSGGDVLLAYNTPLYFIVKIYSVLLQLVYTLAAPSVSSTINSFFSLFLKHTSSIFLAVR